MTTSKSRILYSSLVLFLFLNVTSQSLSAGELSNLFYNNEGSCIIEISQNDLLLVNLNAQSMDLNLSKTDQSVGELFKLYQDVEFDSTQNLNQDEIKRCDSLKKLRQVHHYISLALLPAVYVSSFIQAEIRSFLYSYGIMTTNPTVLVATIIGITGVTTVNILLTTEFEKCNQLDQGKLKQEIIKTLETKYNLVPAGQVDLVIKPSK